MLRINDAFLLVIDPQEKLAAAMYGREDLIRNTVRAVQGAQILGLPILWTEQNPKGLGNTVQEVASIMEDLRPIIKFSFNCLGEPEFQKELEAINRKQAVLIGIEAHVCVYQTAADLVKRGYEVQIAADAVSSRTQLNMSIGLERCRTSGASITSVETMLFELLGKAEGEQFKKMLKVVK
jgi:nicotinamidase-related amidase